MKIDKVVRAALVVALFVLPRELEAGQIRAAVASNFAGAAKVLAERFEEVTGHKVILAFGSTGKHYAQIKNGAPFEVFFAADVARPELLEEEGAAVPGSRFTYAVGRLVLWSPREGYIDRDGAVLERGDFEYLAIANPKLAPYGEAARGVLRARGIWEKLSGRIVRGENISQTLQFVQTGNAELGFVALSQVLEPGRPPQGSYWEIPQTLYHPIEQQAVLLKDTQTARAFLKFVKGDEARSIIQSYGYSTPSGTTKENHNE